MVYGKIIGKIFDAQPKTSANGTKYISLCVTNSQKDKEGNWVPQYYNMSIFQGEWYDRFVEEYKAGTIVPVKKDKANSTKIVINCTVEAGLKYNSTEPELKLKFLSFEHYVNPEVKTSNVQPNYEAAKVNTVAATSEEIENEIPW